MKNTDSQRESIRFLIQHFTVSLTLLLKGLEHGVYISAVLFWTSHMFFVIGIKMSNFIMNLFLSHSLSVCCMLYDVMSYVIRTTLPLLAWCMLVVVFTALFTMVLLFCTVFNIFIFCSCFPATLCLRILSIHILDILMIIVLENSGELSLILAVGSLSWVEVC